MGQRVTFMGALHPEKYTQCIPQDEPQTKFNTEPVNTFTPKSDWYVISPYNKKKIVKQIGEEETID